MKSHSREDLFRYLRGELSQRQRARVERHLEGCAKCRDFLAFVRTFNATLKEMAGAELQPDTPCPDPETLVAFQAEELDEQSARTVRQHTAFCKDCLEELHLLRQAEESPRMKADTSWARTTQVKWQSFVEHLKGSVVDLGKKYGTDTLVGPSRIISEIPRFHTPSTPQIASKIVQVEVGQNLYAITIETLEGNAIICEFFALRQSDKRPLGISVRSASGEKLVTARTDKRGFKQVIVVRPFPPDELVVVTLTLANVEQHLLFRVPCEKLGAGSQLSNRKHVLQDNSIPPYVTIYRIHGPLLFGAMDTFAEILDELDSLPPIVILRLRNMTTIDATGLSALCALADALHDSGRSIFLCGARGQPAELMRQAEFERHLGAENICRSIADALQRAAELYESQHDPSVGILQNYENLVFH
jgi:anti-anti-sigma regulatory factor